MSHHLWGFRFEVSSLGFRVERVPHLRPARIACPSPHRCSAAPDSGFRVQGSGSRVQGSGCMVHGFEPRVSSVAPAGPGAESSPKTPPPPPASDSTSPRSTQPPPPPPHSSQRAPANNAHPPPCPRHLTPQARGWGRYRSTSLFLMSEVPCSWQDKAAVPEEVTSLSVWGFGFHGLAFRV